MNGQRISYPRLAGELVGSINALLSTGGLEVAGDGGAVCSIDPYPVQGAYDSILTLGVAVGGSSIRVRLNAAAVKLALGHLIAMRAFSGLDDDLKLAVLETALAEPLDALADLLGAEVVLEGIVSVGGDDGRSSSREVEAGGAELHSLLIEVCMPPGVTRASVLADLLSPLPASVLERLAASRGPRRRNYGGLPIPVTFELGDASLSAAEFRSLEPGDVVLLDRCHILEGRVRVNVCDSVFKAGTLDGFNLTIENPP